MTNGSGFSIPPPVMSSPFGSPRDAGFRGALSCGFYALFEIKHVPDEIILHAMHRPGAGINERRDKITRSSPEKEKTYGCI